jgi:hypothetical protein
MAWPPGAAVVADSRAMPAMLSVRCSEELRRRVNDAADDCGMSIGDWVRFVVDGACDLHERGPADPPAGAQDAQDDALAPPDPNGPDYAQWVEDRAREERTGIRDRRRARRQARTKRDPEKRPNTRDCPHLIQWRKGPRCGKCGFMVGRMLTFNNQNR